MQDRFIRMNSWSQAGLVLTIVSLLIWGWVALTLLAFDYCAVPAPLAWIPAVATSGVMMASTALSMTPGLDEPIRRYAERLAYAGIGGDIFGAGAYHYIVAADAQPDPLLAVPVGGIPCLMGGLLVHVWSLVQKQARRERAAAEVVKLEADRRRQASIDAESDRTRRVAAENAEHEQKLRRQRELAAEAQRAADETKRQADEAARMRDATQERAEVARVALERPRLVVNNTPRKANAAAPVGQRAQDWLMSQHRAGVDYAEIGPAEIARAIDAKYETCKSSHKTWKAKVTDELRLFADLEEAVG